jgi:hypothetical protein
LISTHKAIHNEYKKTPFSALTKDANFNCPFIINTKESQPNGEAMSVFNS